MPRRKTNFIVSPKDSPDNRVVDQFVSIVLLSEKSGYRMKSYGPIPLLKIGKRCLIDLQIDAIKSAFSDFEIVLCSGFDANKIVKYVRDKHSNINIRIVENQLYENSNSCESLRLCLNNITSSRILIMNGELIFNPDVLSLIKFSSSFIISEQEPNTNLEVGATVNERGTIENFCYGIDNTWSEILFINSRRMAEDLRRIISEPDYKNKFMFEGLNELIKSSHEIRSIINNKSPLTKLSNIKTYHKVRKLNENTNTKLR